MKRPCCLLHTLIPVNVGRAPEASVMWKVSVSVVDKGPLGSFKILRASSPDDALFRIVNEWRAVVIFTSVLDSGDNLEVLNSSNLFGS